MRESLIWIFVTYHIARAAYFDFYIKDISRAAYHLAWMAAGIAMMP